MEEKYLSTPPKTILSRGLRTSLNFLSRSLSLYIWERELNAFYSNFLKRAIENIPAILEPTTCKLLSLYSEEESGIRDQLLSFNFFFFFFLYPLAIEGRVQNFHKANHAR